MKLLRTLMVVLLVLLCGAAGFAGGYIANKVSRSEDTASVHLEEKQREPKAEKPQSGTAALGIYVETIKDSSSMEDGVYVVGFTLDSKAEEAGLEAGDRIVLVDELIIETTTEVSAYIAEKKVGDHVTMVIDRNGEEMSLDLELVEKTVSVQEELPSSDEVHNG